MYVWELLCCLCGSAALLQAWKAQHCSCVQDEHVAVVPQHSTLPAQWSACQVHNSRPRQQQQAGICCCWDVTLCATRATFRQALLWDVLCMSSAHAWVPPQLRQHWRLVLQPATARAKPGAVEASYMWGANLVLLEGVPAAASGATRGLDQPGCSP